MEESPALRTPRRLSWDAILFIALWAAQFWSSEVSAMVAPTPQNNVSLVVFLTRIFSYDPLPGFLLIVLMLYLGADLFFKGRVQFVSKLSAIWLLIILFVVVPTFAAIAYRHNGVPYLYIHDGAIQTEEAVKFLLAGKNPYAENYLSTPMAQWPFYYTGLNANPALYHLPYPPFLLLVSAPFYGVSQASLGWFDERFVYLLLFILSLLMVLRIPHAPREQLAAVMIFGLNPLFTPFFIEGRNDVVASCLLIGAILFLKEGRVGWSALWVAGALASKQTTWFFAPFFIFYVLARDGRLPSGRECRARLRPLVPAAFFLGALMLPFLLWNANAFIGDVLKFQSGALTDGTNYPINSLGLGNLAVGLGWVQHGIDPFPFATLQVIFGGLVLVLLLLWQRLDNRLAQMLLNYALLLLVAGFFSRTFNDNHVGYVLSWLIFPSFVDERSTSPTAGA
jgi:Glycosyltransferase family 87